MKTFSTLNESVEYDIYLEALDLHINCDLHEVFGKISGKLKKYYQFFEDLSNTAKIGVEKIVEIFKNRGVFTFFKRINFSVTNLFRKIQMGFKYYRTLQSAIAEYIAKTGVARWTEQKVKELDEFLKKHPKTKRIVGIGVGAILIYIWLNMSFTGDFDYDFDQSTLIGAIAGNFSLADIFTGPEGIKLLTLFFTGSVLSFPWPGPQNVLFVTSLLYGLAKTYNIRSAAKDLKDSLRNAAIRR